MAHRAGATITEVDGSHVVMVSQPEAVTDVILEAITAVAIAAVGAAGWSSWPRARTGVRDVRQIDAGVLNVGYVDAGPADGPAVLLLHGWPYDIHSFVDVAPLLAAAGYRVIVPYLRGYGTTRFLSGETLRNGEQAALALDIDRADGRARIDRAIVAGFDWGARTADIVAALWPERCKALVSVSGYLIGSRRQPGCRCRRRRSSPGGTSSTSPPSAAGPATSRTGATSPADLADRVAAVDFDDATFERSAAAFDNPDHVDIVIHNYRWRLGLADGEPPTTTSSSGSPRRRSIAVPTITLEGDANGAPHPDAAAYAGKFSGTYEHRIINGGVGHNLPQEAPRAFADAVLEV